MSVLDHARAHRCAFACAATLTLLLGGCDDEAAEAPGVALESAELVGDFDWHGVALPHGVGDQQSLTMATAPAVPTSEPNGAQYDVETFWFHRSDAFAVTMAPGGLFAQTPADIAPFDSAPNDQGLFAGLSVRDEQGDVVGYGSEQHDLDYEGLVSHGTYTLTLPGRGTLMLAHEEDISVIMGEVNDMIINAESIRSYDPALAYVSTQAQTGRIVGGTGEFAHAKGVWREVVVLHEFNLQTLEHSFEAYIQIALLPNAGQGD